MRAWLPEQQVSGPEPATERDVAGLNRVFADAFTDRYRRDGLVGVRVPYLNPQVWRYALLDAGAGSMLWRDESGHIVAFNIAHRSGTEGWRGALAVRPDPPGGRPPAGARARRRIRLHPRVAPHGRARPGRRVAGRRGRRPERRGAVARGAARGRAAQGRGARPQARRPRRGDVRRRDRGDGGGCGAARHPARGDSLSDAVRRSVPSPRRARLPRPLDRPAHDLRGLSGAASHRGRAVFQLGDLRLTAGLVIFALTYLLIAVQRLPF